MVHFSVFKKAERSDSGERILSGQRLSAVIEIDNVGFPEA
jgi:hypothetical protein